MSKAKKIGIGIGVFVVLGIIGSFLPDSKEEKNSTPPKQEVAAESENKETVDVSNLELTDEKYITAIKSTNKDIGEVNIEGDKVTVIFKEDMAIWDEKSLVKDMSIDGVDIFKKAFENTKVNTVEIIVRTAFTDSYGKEEVQDAINITWTRETSDKVDYGNYKNVLYSDYTKLYMISDGFTIHPVIWKELDQNDKDNMSL